MKLGWALVMIAAAGACSGGASRVAMDGGSDAGADAGMVPDADPTADTDGDGVLDTVDVCPSVADPAQVDLDGDQIGWMCDPIESTTIPFAGDLGFMPLAVRGHTMGAALSYACVNGACQHESFSVGPGGHSRAEEQTDGWLNGLPLRAFVTAEDHVLWSLDDGVLGDQDAATDTFTTRHTGGRLGFSGGDGDGVTRYERGPLLVLSSDARDTSIDSYDLLVPQANGGVTSIATSSMPFVKPTVVGQNPPRLVFGIDEPGNRSLREHVAGTTTSQPLVVAGTVLSNADVVQRITRLSIGGHFGFCVEQGNKRFIVETYDEVFRSYEAPITSCVGSVQQTKDLRLTLISGLDSAFVVINGVPHPIAISGGLEVMGTSVPAVITRRNGATTTVYVVDATGALFPVTSDGVGSNDVVSEGGTVHFISVHGSSVALARFRNGTTTEVPLPAIPDHEHWDLFTTHEGAALVSTASRALVWPSQAAITAPVDFDSIEGLVRGGATFFVASHNDPRSQPALYSYTEVGGVPQYTAHTPEVLQNVAFTMAVQPLGLSVPYNTHAVPMTDWFMYRKNGECQLVWPMITGTTVSLQGNVSCLGGAAMRGVTPGGTPVLWFAGSISPEQLYLMNGHTLTKVVEGRYLKLLYDAPESPRLLGWAGQDAGGTRFLCTASQPDQCWTPPDEPRIWGPLVPAQLEGLHVLFTQRTLGVMSMTFTSIRTFGPGTRAQPL